MKETEFSFETCIDQEEHAMQIMNWRNDPTTLEQFYHHEPKNWETFWPEYRKEYLVASPRPVFARLKGARVAFLRFNLVSHPRNLPGLAVDISINVAPEARGKGIGTRVLVAIQGHLKSLGAVAIVAEVRQANTPSLKVFRKAGFEDLGIADITVPDTGEKIAICRFVCQLNGQ